MSGAGSDGETLSEVARLEAEVARLSAKLREETLGRTRAERAHRAVFLASTSGIGNMRPIGVMSSCFPGRFGTPRQGSLAGLSRGIVQVDPSVVGPESLTGLDGFSHAWVVFIFHENTNMHKLADDEAAPKQRRKFPSFVRPPQAAGTRVGLFATRTPHRPNPVGLSLARVHSVDAAKGELHLRGIDLVDGTPILDVKPFVPHVDRPEAAARCPPWVVNPSFDAVPVELAPDAEAALRAACARGEARFFARDEPDELVAAVRQVLALDPRGLIHGRGHFKGAAQGESKDLQQGKEHLWRDSFCLNFDAFKLRFAPRQQQRGIVVLEAALTPAVQDQAAPKGDDNEKAVVKEKKDVDQVVVKEKKSVDQEQAIDAGVDGVTSQAPAPPAPPAPAPPAPAPTPSPSEE